MLDDVIDVNYCRSPHGERGLKSVRFVEHIGCKRRSPHGERGLKSGHDISQIGCGKVAPLTGSVD